jgi:hypothetical protein
VLAKWNFGPGEPPLPGRVALRLAEVIARFRAGVNRSDLSAIRAALEELESLHTALELWTSAELDHTALLDEVPDSS